MTGPASIQMLQPPFQDQVGRRPANLETRPTLLMGPSPWRSMSSISLTAIPSGSFRRNVFPTLAAFFIILWFVTDSFMAREIFSAVSLTLHIGFVPSRD